QDLPLLEHLRGNRDAMLAQARMLEQVWWWYLAPFAFGVTGLVLSIGGFTPKTVAYAGFVLVLCVLIGLANRYAARAVFRAHADEIERQIENLTSEETRS
ncbi:MAG TPA: hypothetical protein VFO79_16780, partial [Xanthomonadales bacterium]|nr:hypothetical protein [Xanthomonadales bacterium]